MYRVCIVALDVRIPGSVSPGVEVEVSLERRILACLPQLKNIQENAGEWTARCSVTI